ncbi:MAG: SPOR domain-containing protein [Bacteroidota bacterium]
MKRAADKSIWDYIKDLLHQHDCVIVPGFGGFVCNREPSKIDQVSHVITPPSRKVVFNQNLKSNDGLLAGYMAQQQGISYNDAIQFIEENVKQTMTVLQDQKQLMIDLFGNFRLNADANYVFLPDKRNNYLTSSFGLGFIQATPVAARAVKVGKVKVFREIKTPQKARKSRNVWPTVLAGVMVLLLSVNGYIFFSDHSISDLRIGGENTMSITSWFDSLFSKNDSVKPVEQPIAETAVIPEEEKELIPAAPAPVEEIADTTSIQPIEQSTPEAVETVTAHTETIEESADAYASLYAFASHFAATRGTIVFPQRPVEEIIPAEAVVAEVGSPEETNTPVVPTPTIKPSATHLSTEGVPPGYYVIGGVFCKERNAQRFINQLTQAGFTEATLLVNADINCKRVSYHRFESRKDAELFCRDIKKEGNPGAWVLASE